MRGLSIIEPMVIDMNEAQVRTLEQVRQVVARPEPFGRVTYKVDIVQALVAIVDSLSWSWRTVVAIDMAMLAALALSASIPAFTAGYCVVLLLWSAVRVHRARTNRDARLEGRGGSQGWRPHSRSVSAALRLCAGRSIDHPSSLFAAEPGLPGLSTRAA